MKELTNEEVCLALGYFDSVHLGHRNLISESRKLADKMGCGLAVATFTNNAYKQFNEHDKQVYTYPERCELLKDLCDYVLPMRFDSRLKNCSAEMFLEHLISVHNIKAMTCGYDYLFGKGARGDAELLSGFCSSHGIECLVVPKFETDSVRISTTAVKSLLAEGSIERANEFLGEPFFVTGKVVHGRGAGRLFDIPTANIKFPSSKLLPKSGAYGVVCTVDGKQYFGAANVGNRPTFGMSKLVVEVMIAEFNENIYDKEIKLSFRKYLRPIVCFETPAQLSKQVHKDIGWNKHD